MRPDRVRPTTLSAVPVTREQLRERVEKIPLDLRSALEMSQPDLPEAWRHVERFDVTGIGASEGPARLLVSELLDLGICARFTAAAHYLRPAHGTSTALVAFSQGLSPNARLALRQAPLYDASLLLTALTGPENASPPKLALLAHFEKDGGVRWTHAPTREGGSLVRLVGPACASLMGLRFVVRLAKHRGLRPPPWANMIHHVPNAVERSFREAPNGGGSDPLALLGTAPSSSMLRSLAWKWQEGLFTRLPPDFDVLSFMHGPLQSLHGTAGTMILCRGPAHAADDDLVARLRQVLSREPQRLVEVQSTLPGPLAWFEFDAAFNQMVLREIEARRLSPGDWPAQGLDAPLYQLGE